MSASGKRNSEYHDPPCNPHRKRRVWVGNLLWARLCDSTGKGNTGGPMSVSEEKEEKRRDKKW